MSADNHAWIRPTKNGKWAVKIISSLYPESRGWTDWELDKQFQGSPEFETEEEACDAADRMIEEAESLGHYVEYGTAFCPRMEHCSRCGDGTGSICNQCMNSSDYYEGDDYV